jgi:predicted  nucleic acid-binding Zn-ribbon protein
MKSMSDNGSQVVNPSDLRDASRERLLAEIGLLQHRYSLTDAAQLESQIVQLENQINSMKHALADSEMRLLQARDYARGCAAELGEAQANFALHQQLANQQVRQARKKLRDVYATRTWKIGRLIMLPARIARHVFKVG